MAGYSPPQPDAIEIRLRPYDPPAPEAVELRLGSEGGTTAQVTIDEAGNTSTGSAAVQVQVAATIAEPGVVSVGYITNDTTLHALIDDAGAPSAGTIAGSVTVGAWLAAEGTVSSGIAQANVTWPSRVAAMVDGGVVSAGALAATVTVSATAGAGGDASAGMIVAAARVTAVLDEAGYLSVGMAAGSTVGRRTAVIHDLGVRSRSWTASIVGSSAGIEVPEELLIEEKHGRVLSDNSAELTYIIRHTHDDAVARQALLNGSPWSWRGKRREDAEVEEIGHHLWLGTVRYSERETQRQVNQSRFSFETRGGSQHISQSLATVGRHAAAGMTAPDFGGAIGVDGDSVQGTEITVPVYTFTETHYFDDVSTGYKSTLFYLTGRVNDASFKGLAAGEALFLGAAGTKPGGDEPWEITFAFAGSPNVSGLSIGEITGIAKKGWEYLWVRYTEAEDTAAKMLIRKPIAVYVERVYREGNFASLGIGT